jgi:prophage regulatory protein
MQSRILRNPAVLRATGLSPSALDREVLAGRFPRPVKLTSAPNCRAVGWPSVEVDAWITDRIAAARGAKAAA